MPVETQWHTENRVAYQRFYGIVTLEDFETSTRQALQYVNEGMAPVHVMTDLRDIIQYPSLIQLTQSARTIKYDGTGWTVVITQKPILRFMATVIVQITPGKYQVAPTLEKALDFLAEKDTSLLIGEN